MSEKNNDFNWDSSPIAKDEAKQLIKLQKKFLKSYIENKQEMKLESWLERELKDELPDKKEEEIKEISNSIIERVKLNQKNREALEQAKKKGMSNEQWFAKEIDKSSKAIGVNNMGNYLQKIDNALLEANTAMYETITNKNGQINQNLNLDGFIAEQHKANTFNLDAAIKDKNYKAEALDPAPGQKYGKNSVDGQIKDYNQDGKVVRRYQEKFGKDANATKEGFKNGDYRGQRKGVPKDQVDQIEGAEAEWEYKDVKGKGLTKKEAKRKQQEAQKGNEEALKEDWNHYEVKRLAKNVGKKAAFAGVTSAGISVGYEVVSKTIKGEEIEAEEVLSNAVKTGIDTGGTVALAGAIKVAAEKGMIKIIPKGTPGGTIANIVYTGVENAKILGKISTGELSVKKGLNKMEEITTSTTLGTILAAKGTAIGAGIGAAALSWIPVVGTGVGAAVGGFVGGTVSYIAGSKVGKAVAKTAQKVRKTAKKVAKKVVDTGAKVVKKVKDKVKNTANKVINKGKSVCKSIASALGF